MALEKELETYRKNLPLLLKDEGRFALVQGDAVSGIFDTYGDALDAGYAKFELRDFMVKKIETVEEVHFLSHPCNQIESDAWMIAQGFQTTTPEEDKKYAKFFPEEFTPEKMEILEGLKASILYPQDTEGSRIVAEAIVKYHNLTTEERKYLLDAAMEIIHQHRG